MIYLGPPTGKPIRRLMRSGFVGALTSPDQGYSPATIGEIPVWAADNGCFASSQAGEPFDFDRWLRWLDRMASGPFMNRERCLWATVPDVVGDHDATLALWENHYDLTDRGWRPAFVAQDGAEVDTIPWDDLACLFIGGTTGWKLGAQARTLIAHAKTEGKWVHVGRVNSRKRLLAAAAAGAHSVDGTYWTNAPGANLPDVLSWLESSTMPQGVLAF